MNKLSILINEQTAYEHDKTNELTDAQLEFLDKMDTDLDRGFKIRGDLISEPDTQQRATFIAMNLIRAIMQEDMAKIQVSCAYLSNRLPELSEVHARDDDGQVKIELVEDTE